MNNNLKKNTKDELIYEILKLREKNKDLENKVKDLNGKLNTNITNSGIPSSKEIFKKNKYKIFMETYPNIPFEFIIYEDVFDKLILKI